MPPRFVYWTIIAGGLPTAFRAAERDELLPTFNRIQEKHPDAVMKYFARGKLWESEAEARQEADARRARASRPEARGRDWRPGGDHRDPRQKFKDAKKTRNLNWRRERFERRQASSAEPPREQPHGDPLRRPAGRPPGGDRKAWGPPRERKAGSPPRERKAGGPSRERKFDGPPRERKPAGDRPWRPKGPPRDRKPGGPRREFKPGGPPRDRRRRG
jgi:hypothetical protein